MLNPPNTSRGAFSSPSNPTDTPPTRSRGHGPPLAARILVAVLCAAMLSACGSDSNERSAEVLEFTADATTIAAGDTATLSYRVDGNPPPNVSLVDEGAGDALDVQGTSGGLDVMPDATTTYVLTASNKAGEVSERLTITVVQPPQVLSFNLETEPQDGLVAEGEDYRLVWRIEGDYDTVSVGGDPIPEGENGVVLTASESTTHTLSVTWFDGLRTLESEPLQVDVLLRPVILSFEASHTEGVRFETDVELTWELDGGPPDSIFITEEGGGGVDLAATSYVRERVTNSITHGLEVRNRAGSAEAEVRIEVDPASAPDGFLKIHNDRVVVMRVSETEVVRFIDDMLVEETLPQSLNSGIRPEALRDITMAFYERFDDVFDFLIVLGGMEETEASVYDDGVYPWYDDQFIFSDDDGLGRRGYSRREYTEYFGSPGGELRGLSFHPHLGDLRNGPSLREIMRHWGLPFIPTLARRSPCVHGAALDAYTDLNGRCIFGGEHEGFAGFSSNDGQLGGFNRGRLVLVEEAVAGHDTVDAYRAGEWSLFGSPDNSIPYSDWELYAAGMKSGEEFCNFDYMDCADNEVLWVAQQGVWFRDAFDRSIKTDPLTGDRLFLSIGIGSPDAAFSDYVVEMDIGEVILSSGPREPPSADAVQAFIGAVIVLADPTHLPTDEQLDRVAEDVSWFSSPAPNSDLMYNFFEATGGRGQLDLEGLPQRMLQIVRETEVGPVARPPALGGPPAPTEVLEPGRGRLDTSTVRAAAVDER